MGKLRKDNILHIHSGSQFREKVRGIRGWKPVKFVLIVPRIGFGKLRQGASWEMLRPYRHWLVKDILDRRSGTISRRKATYLPFRELSQWLRTNKLTRILLVFTLNRPHHSPPGAHSKEICESFKFLNRIFETFNFAES